MAWTTPRTWAAGEVLTAALLNAHLRDNLAALRPAYATTLPASPADGDIAVLVDSLTAPTYQWTFRYNAGSSNGDKWEFVGGTPAFATVDTQENMTSGGAIHDLATVGPTFTVPRAGVYLVRWGVNMTPQTGGAFNSTGIAEIWNGTSAQLGTKVCQIANQGAEYAIATEDRISGLAASTAIRVRYKNSIGGGTAGYARFRFLTVTPIRVS